MNGSRSSPIELSEDEDFVDKWFSGTRLEPIVLSSDDDSEPEILSHPMTPERSRSGYSFDGDGVAYDIMLSMGYSPGKGLGPQMKGNVTPVTTSTAPGKRKRGVGFESPEPTQDEPEPSPSPARETPDAKRAKTKARTTSPPMELSYPESPVAESMMDVDTSWKAEPEPLPLVRRNSQILPAPVAPVRPSSSRTNSSNTVLEQSNPETPAMNTSFEDYVATLSGFAMAAMPATMQAALAADPLAAFQLAQTYFNLSPPLVPDMTAYSSDQPIAGPSTAPPRLLPPSTSKLLQPKYSPTKPQPLPPAKPSPAKPPAPPKKEKKKKEKEVKSLTHKTLVQPPPLPHPTPPGASGSKKQKAILGWIPLPKFPNRGIFEMPIPVSENPAQFQLYGEPYPHTPIPENCLVMEDIPNAFRTLTFVRSWADEFGAKWIVMDKVTGKALIEFSTRNLAQIAYGSPRLTGGTWEKVGHVRVFWYRRGNGIQESKADVAASGERKGKGVIVAASGANATAVVKTKKEEKKVGLVKAGNTLPPAFLENKGKRPLAANTVETSKTPSMSKRFDGVPSPVKPEKEKRFEVAPKEFLKPKPAPTTKRLAPSATKPYPPALPDKARRVVATSKEEPARNYNTTAVVPERMKPGFEPLEWSIWDDPSKAQLSPESKTQPVETTSFAQPQDIKTPPTSKTRLACAAPLAQKSQNHSRKPAPAMDACPVIISAPIPRVLSNQDTKPIRPLPKAALPRPSLIRSDSSSSSQTPPPGAPVEPRAMKNAPRGPRSSESRSESPMAPAPTTNLEPILPLQPVPQDGASSEAMTRLREETLEQRLRLQLLAKKQLAVLNTALGLNSINKPAGAAMGVDWANHGQDAALCAIVLEKVEGPAYESHSAQAAVPLQTAIFVDVKHGQEGSSSLQSEDLDERGISSSDVDSSESSLPKRCQVTPDPSQSCTPEDRGELVVTQSLENLATSFINETLEHASDTTTVARLAPLVRSSKPENELFARQQALAQQIAESKLLMQKYQAAKTKVEKDEIMQLLKEQNRSMAAKTMTPVTRKNPKFCWPQGVPQGMLVISDDEDEDCMDES